MILLVAISISRLTPLDIPTLKQRGLEVVEQIRREYYLPKSRLYCESIDRNGKKSGPCFNWPMGVLVSALNAAARADSKYKPWLKEYVDASHVYWNDKGPVPGYDVLPGPKPVDRYYDDNAWMVLGLVETYEILQDRKYLDWAEETLKYVLSGWDDKLGGGIYWHETDKKGKNTCSNAPSAAACLAVAKYRRSEELTAMAGRIMDWTQKNLRDPVDGLYWDGMNLSGKIDKTKWTYNTGLSIRSWAILGGQDSLAQTIRSSIDHWFDPVSGAAKDDGKFAHLLFEGLAIAKKDDKDVQSKIVGALDYLYAKVRNPVGRYGNRWEKPFDPEQKSFHLIDQASAARGFLFAAERFDIKN